MPLSSLTTEQSVALEVKIEEQKEITRERDMKDYIQLLQQELDKRSSETVVMAAKMREMKTQSHSQPDGETSESTSQPVSEPYYKRENDYFS